MASHYEPFKARTMLTNSGNLLRKEEELRLIRYQHKRSHQLTVITVINRFLTNFSLL